MRHPDYSAIYKVDSPEARAEEGGITVMSADNTEAAQAMGAVGRGRTRQADRAKQPWSCWATTACSHVVASGDAAVDEQIERRALINRNIGHPLMDRYFHHMKTMNASHGLWRNSEGWHALAEKYVVTLGAANTLGLPGKESEPGSFYFEPRLMNAWGTAPRSSRPTWACTRPRAA